jgi:hypothetical protein
MFFFFVCGEHTFRKEVPGYEGMVCQCHHCGNMAAHVQKSNPWFTFCWIVGLISSNSSFSQLTAIAAAYSFVHLRLYRCRMPNLQLPSTARESPRCQGYGQRRRTTTAAMGTSSRRTPRATAYAIRLRWGGRLLPLLCEFANEQWLSARLTYLILRFFSFGF